MKTIVRTSVYLDSDSHNALDELPRKVNASKLMRWMAKAITTDDKAWKKLIKEDPEIREVQEFLRPKVRKIFALPDVEERKGKGK